MNRPSVTAIGIAWVAALQIATVTPALAQSPATTPAVWTPHAILVDLDKLPKRYSCDQLWYKFRAVLLSIGARPGMTITPFYCDSPSPSVELLFSIPQAVRTPFADLEASNNTITLEPGHPAPLDSADCELLRQIKDGLFPELPLHVMSFRLACEAPQTTHVNFRVTVQAFTPEPKAAIAAAGNSGTGSTAAHTRPHG